MDDIIKKLKEIDHIEDVVEKYESLIEFKSIFNKKIDTKIEKVLKSSDNINLLCGIHVGEPTSNSYVYKRLLNVLKRYKFKKSDTSYGFQKNYNMFSISIIPDDIYQYYNISICFKSNRIEIIKDSKDMESFFNSLGTNLDNLDAIYSDIERYFSKKDCKFFKKIELIKSFKNNLKIIEKFWFNGVKICEKNFSIYISTEKESPDCYVKFQKDDGSDLCTLVCFYPETIKDIRKIIYFSNKIYKSILKI